MDANNTLDAGKANAVMADFTDKMDKIVERAQAVNVSVILILYLVYLLII